MKDLRRQLLASSMAGETIGVSEHQTGNGRFCMRSRKRDWTVSRESQWPRITKRDGFLGEEGQGWQRVTEAEKRSCVKWKGTSEKDLHGSFPNPALSVGSRLLMSLPVPTSPPNSSGHVSTFISHSWFKPSSPFNPRYIGSNFFAINFESLCWAAWPPLTAALYSPSLCVPHSC